MNEKTCYGIKTKNPGVLASYPGVVTITEKYNIYFWRNVETGGGDAIEWLFFDNLIGTAKKQERYKIRFESSTKDAGT